MDELEWSWLCLPYIVCALLLVAVGLVAALVRGDRVLRLGTIGAAFTALPWAVCSALAVGTHEPALAEKLLRLGSGPVALIGPNLLIVLLGATGQLEPNRWLARIAAAVGVLLMALCWAPRGRCRACILPSGIYYIDAGPLTGLHLSQLDLAGGRTRDRAQDLCGGRAPADGPPGDRRARVQRDRCHRSPLVYEIAGWFPIAWLPATIAASVALYLRGGPTCCACRASIAACSSSCSRSRSRSSSSRSSCSRSGVSLLAYAVIGSVVWVVALGVAWAAIRDRPVGIARERALEEFLATVADAEDEDALGARLAALWQAIEVVVRRTYRIDDANPLEPAVAAWLVAHGEALASSDLGTMRLGALCPKLEAMVGSTGASLIVPLIDRGTLVGLVEADHDRALREAERGLVVESARAARTLAYLRSPQRGRRARARTRGRGRPGDAAPGRGQS
ncbi:MAG: GAF domain-containing protein [Kofleriaceae bacterium]